MRVFNVKKFLNNAVKGSKPKKTEENKLLYYTKTLLLKGRTVVNKIISPLINIARGEKFDEISSLVKDIVLYGIIGYPAYHLMFVRSNTLLTLLGCGCLYYLFRDVLDYVITTISMMPRGVSKR